MSESERRSTEDLFSEAKAIRSEHRTTSNELEKKLEFMQKKIEDHSSFLNCGFCTRSNKGVSDAYKRAFKTLNLSEQVSLFWRICTTVKEVKLRKMEEEFIDPKNPEKEMLDTTIYIKDKNEYKVWTVTRIKASLKTKKIVITDTSAVIDLHDYLIRSARNKERECFALEATNIQEPLQTIKISNEGHGFEETYRFFKKMKKKALYDEICSLIDPTMLEREQIVEIKIPTGLTKKPSIKIASSVSPTFEPVSIIDKMITFKLISPQYAKNPIKKIEKDMLEKEMVVRLRDSSYNEIHKTLLPINLLNKLEDVSGGGWDKVKENDEFQVFYNRAEQKVKKFYRLKCSDIIIFDWIVDELNNFSNFKKWKPKMESISCLKVFPSEKTKVYHEVCRHEPKNRINYAFIRHHFYEPNPSFNGLRSKKIYYFYDQSIVPSIAKDYFGIKEPLAEISYIIWKFYELHDTMNLIVEAKCDHFTTPENNLRMIETYLGDFEKLKNHAANYSEPEFEDSVILNTVLFENEYIERIEEIESIDNDTEYFTVTEENSSGKNNTLLNKKPTEKIINTSLARSMERRVSFEEMDLTNKENLLKFKHPILPYKKGKPNLVLPQTSGGHFQWEKEWIINDKGELINTNKEKIQAQNNVLKSVVKRLGRNIFKGKNILSISLPVDAFGDDSNLSRLCNSYGYGPVFLEEAAKLSDPLERLKKVMSFAISTTVIYIRMDKPFNPILGETYQSIIDGCPVYGEQISHHPPISAVLFKGRGWTLYGHLEAKVEMSLNSASGINDGQIHVSFNKDDLTKDEIMYTSPPGELGGLIYGERKMSLIKKSYYFDPINLLHCELKWSKQKGKSKYINNYFDGVEGQIVKLKPGFDKSNWKNVKKEDIEKEYGLINGRWTGAVYYDEQLLFDTYKTFPYKVEPYEALLESDVSKRKDLILRSTSVDLEEAQNAKEELEEIQRNDRKLRAQYGKGGH